MADTRAADIATKKSAIVRKLQETNRTNQKTALNSIDAKKGGTKKYATQSLAGKDQGFTDSDFGVGAGAAIPYQINSGTGSVTKAKAKAPVVKAKPKAKPKATGGHTSYKVQKGDTLSSIAKKNGTTVKAIWDYNMKNRSKKTQAILKKRGKNMIFRGGTFYIPK